MKNTNNISYLKRGLLSGGISFVFVMTLIGVGTALGSTAPASAPPTGLASPTFSGLTVNGMTTSGGFFSSGHSVLGTLNLNGPLVVNLQQVTSEGLTDYGTLWVKDVVTFMQKLTIVSGGLEVTNGSVVIGNGNLSVTGTTTSTGKITASGGLEVTLGNVLIKDGSLTVTGTTTSTGKITASGGLDVGGNLNITGGISNGPNQANTPADQTNTPVYIKDALNVSDYAEFGSTLVVNGFGVFDGGLATDGLSYFRGKILGPSGVSSNPTPIDIQSSVNITGNLKLKKYSPTDAFGNLILDTGKILKSDGTTSYLKPVKASTSQTVAVGAILSSALTISCGSGSYPISCEYGVSSGQEFTVSDLYTSGTSCYLYGKNRGASSTTVTLTANCVSY